MTSTRLIVIAAALGVAAACSKDPSSPGDDGTQPKVLEALPRALSSAETKVVSGANDFTFALFRQLSTAQPGVNVFASPLSASMSLGMTLNGARGGTFDAMRTALQLGNASQQEINEGYRSLIALLRGLDPSVQFAIANSIWHTNEVQFAPAFLDAGRTHFDATVQGLDFRNASAALSAINGWVNDRTKGKIPTILDELPQDYVMFLINAIYFNGNWRTRFDPAKTVTAPFRPTTAAAQTARLMTMTAPLPYAETATAQVVDLPYGNAAFRMTVVLPKEGTSLQSMAASLTPAAWTTLLAGVRERQVELFLPKLKLEYERQLRDDLTALGMGVAFSDFANFSGMTTGPNAFTIGFVKQKTFVDIHEEGTEAAAVTVTGIVPTSVPVIPVMRIDRPYLFAIREHLSGTVLFIGKIERMP
jgi:serpin B